MYARRVEMEWYLDSGVVYLDIILLVARRK
jgi:hypothetical protein